MKYSAIPVYEERGCSKYGRHFIKNQLKGTDMVRQAIIMAGGLGSRLKDKTAAMPKGFIEIEGKALAEMSVQKLFAIGVEEIIIGTGHCSEWYERLAEKYHCIKCVKNTNYKTTGSMGTLALCVPYIEQSAFVLESDLIYDIIGLHALLQERAENVMLGSGKTNSGDEVYLECCRNGFLTNLSKDKAKVKNVFAELVGISKLSKTALEAALKYYKESNNPMMEYEHTLAAISNAAVSEDDKIKVKKIEYYAWREIDDENHLKMAAETVYPRIKENESLYAVKREVLLNPGPATTTDSVKYAQVCADICPREKEFGAVMEWICRELPGFAGRRENITAVLFGGSGTAADEVMISSCIPDGAKTLIVDNGAYGKRFTQIAESYNIPYTVYKSSSYLPINIGELKQKLLKEQYTHFVIVYHETTTGLLNPVPELCRFCKEHNITTIVDAVSAYCAIPIDMEKDGIDFMASTSNKNIQGMAGAAFVLCQNTALQKIKDYPMRSFYLNLQAQHEYFLKTKQTRFTPPVQTLYALRQAIIETKIETVKARWRRISDCWDTLVKTVDELGLKMLVPREVQSKLITAIIEPDNGKYNFETMHDLARKQGFTIYPGKLSEANTFRIANIGDIQVFEMERFTEFLKAYMKKVL